MKAQVNPKSTSNQSSKPCTVLQYPSKKSVLSSLPLGPNCTNMQFGIEEAVECELHYTASHDTTVYVCTREEKNNWMHTAMQNHMRVTPTNAYKATSMIFCRRGLPFCLFCLPFLFAHSISLSSPHYRCRKTTYKQGQELQTHGQRVCRPKQASIIMKTDMENQ